jgi:hypothetical protein
LRYFRFGRRPGAGVKNRTLAEIDAQRRHAMFRVVALAPIPKPGDTFGGAH